MKLRSTSFFILLLLFTGYVMGQRVVWWNVENLFDCRHDTLKQDQDFLPQGIYQWTPSRYWHKIDNVARTLAAISQDEEWPMLVGLGEIENDSVLHDLTLRSPLRIAGYAYIHHEGSDLRGIDCALLYQPHLFHPLGSEHIQVPSKEHGIRPTRDLLHCWGILNSGDTLHVLCVHFPSRAGNTRISGIHRKLAAETLCHRLDSIGERKILVMGDFNATATDPVFDIIGQRLTFLTPTGRKEKRKPQGTYCYQGLWDYIDHILVSKSLRLYCSKQITVGRFPFLLNRDGTPCRTYRGTFYQGGISDHLPIWADLFIR
ncbi:MAG: endonuclease/exonuclease/phosphatase family protein [Bacteroidaceae bacterium]